MKAILHTACGCEKTVEVETAMPFVDVAIATPRKLDPWRMDLDPLDSSLGRTDMFIRRFGLEPRDPSSFVLHYREVLAEAKPPVSDFKREYKTAWIDEAAMPEKAFRDLSEFVWDGGNPYEVKPYEVKPEPLLPKPTVLEKLLLEEGL